STLSYSTPFTVIFVVMPAVSAPRRASLIQVRRRGGARTPPASAFGRARSSPVPGSAAHVGCQADRARRTHSLPARSPVVRPAWRCSMPLAALVAIAVGLLASAPVGAPRPHRGADPGAPRLFAPGVVSTRDYERDGTFTPDGTEFYFTKRTIWSSHLTI